MSWAKGRQLRSVSKSGLSMQFKYNQSGIRTSKTVNGVKTEYTYVGDMLVSQKTGNEVINFAYTAGGAPLGFTYNGTPYFYLLNLQGDIISIYDGTGEIVVDYTYDTWGKLISVTGSLADTIGVKNPLRYRGYYYDTETSLYYLQSRYYDPETCRFINPDAYVIAGDDYIQGTNMYAYCYNNPVMYSDPSGYAVDSSTSNELADGLNLLLSVCVLYFLVNMSGQEIVDLLSLIDDSGDMVYVSHIIFNGYMHGQAFYLFDLHEGIEKEKKFQVCKAFKNKDVCLKVAEYYGWAYDGEESNAVFEIAKEIYGHAMMYYEFNTVKPAIDFVMNLIDSKWGTTNSHADPIELGENPSYYIPIFNTIWLLY